MKPQNVVVVVNPNPMIPYRIQKAIQPSRVNTGTNAGKRSYEFMPFDEYEVDVIEGIALANGAKHAWNNMKQQASMERKEWSKRINHPNMNVRDMASKYCDENGNSKSVPLPFPGIVNIDTEEGRSFLEQGKKLAQELDGERLREYVKKYGGLVITEAHEVFEEPEEDQVEPDEPKGIGDEKPKIEAPSEEWNNEKKVEYIQQYLHKDVPNFHRGRDDILNSQIAKAFEAAKARFEKAGVDYEVV
ncbi:MAG: hypothetical protein R6U98_06590 [Pirellulaceae bacterium]